MENRRTSLIGGGILILIGLFFLALQVVPGLGDLIDIRFTWPLIVVLVGFLLFIVGIAVGEPDMAVPACIVAGIGFLLYWQNATGRWQSWAYVWALIPGFAGVGVILSSLMGGDERVIDGFRTILVSLIMFAIAGSFLGPFGFLGRYWPVLLILLGLVILAQGLFHFGE